MTSSTFQSEPIFDRTDCVVKATQSPFYDDKYLYKITFDAPENVKEFDDLKTRVQTKERLVTRKKGGGLYAYLKDAQDTHAVLDDATIAKYISEVHAPNTAHIQHIRNIETGTFVITPVERDELYFGKYNAKVIITSYSAMMYKGKCIIKNKLLADIDDYRLHRSWDCYSIFIDFEEFHNAYIMAKLIHSELFDDKIYLNGVYKIVS